MSSNQRLETWVRWHKRQDIIKWSSTTPNNAAHWVNLHFVLLFVSDLHSIGSHYSQNPVDVVSISVHSSSPDYRIHYVANEISENGFNYHPQSFFFLCSIWPKSNRKKSTNTNSANEFASFCLPNKSAELIWRHQKRTVFIFTPYRLTLLSIHSIVS